MKKVFFIFLIGSLAFNVFLASAAPAELFSTSLYSDPALIAYYRLGDVSDQKAAYNLTNVNSVTFVTAGAKFITSSYTSNADNPQKYLNSASAMGFVGGASSTYMGWFKTDRVYTTTQCATLWSHSATTNGFLEGLNWNYNNGDSYFQYQRYQSGNINFVVSSTASTFSSTTYSHFAATYSGSVVSLYINGSLVRTSSLSGTTASFGNNFRLGADVHLSGGSCSWSGFIDDFAIFKRNLSAAEILEVYNGASPTSLPKQGIIFFSE